MRIIDQGYKIKLLASFDQQLNLIEDCGRVAYASEDKIADGSSKQFAKMIMGKNHGAVLEHSILTVIFVTDRGVSHEIVRHRLASYTQESTRFCNYAKDKFNGSVTYIRPVWIDKDWVENHGPEPVFGGNSAEDHWWQVCNLAEDYYLRLLKLGWTPQQARSVLPNSLKTKIAVTTNFREWQHIFRLRAISKAAHPQMRDLMIPLYEDCRTLCPEVFELGDVE